MDVSSWAVFITLLLTAIYSQSRASRQTNEQKVGVVVNKLEHLLKDITNLRQSINQLDTDITTSLPEDDDCSNGKDERCHPTQVQDQLKLMDFLNSYGSPGKRSRRDVASDLHGQLHQRRTQRSLEDLYRKRYVLRNLRAVLDNAERVIRAERKRSCNLNLGFHCQTDEYSSIADLYDFLASDISPGKRKRAVAVNKDMS